MATSLADMLSPQAGNGHSAIMPSRPLTSDRLRRIEGTFLVSEGVMLMLASMIFAAAEGSPIPALGALLAPLALYLVDYRKVTALPNLWAGLLGLAAMVFSILEFLVGDVESRLLAAGHFMSFLSWIVLWQSKTWKQHWMLAALSILQVAVGAVLTNSHYLGIGLLAFVVVGLWTMCLFTMYRLVQGAESVQVEPTRSIFPVRGFRAGARSHADPLLTDSMEDGRGINPRFVLIVLAVMIASFLFAVAAFLLVPRVWVGHFQLFDNSPLPGGRPLSGFTSEVRLGELGQILESSEPVMDIEFYDDASGAKLTLREAFELLNTTAPLFRGVVLERYQSGRWSSSEQHYMDVTIRPSPGERFLRQEVRLYPIGTRTIFTTGNPFTCIGRDPPRRLFVNNVDRVFTRDNDANLRTDLRYYVLSELDDFVRARPPLSLWVEQERHATTEIPEQLKELSEFARQLVADQGILATDREKADFLERWLRDSGEFSYTLNLAVIDPDVDPIHDFVFNRRSGHCEYFAAALTIMLRSVGIHARLVSGFKGGVNDLASETLRVRQLHAHAWVEAFVDGHWYQFDPTPASRNISVAELQQDRGWNWGFNFRGLWMNGVMWSQETQQQLIYAPLQAGAEATWETIRSPAASVNRFIVVLRELLQDPSRWFSWEGAAIGALISILVLGLWKMFRLVVQLLRQGMAGAEMRDHGRSSVRFYERFEALLQRLSLRRRQSQTQQEFASLVRQTMHAWKPVEEELSDLPDDVTRCFYSVRFGGLQIDPEVETDLQARLDQLEQQLGELDRRSREKTIPS